MPFPDNFIGPHQFLRLEGPWMLPREVVQVQARPGVDGLIAFLTGRRAEPFTARSFVDQPTLIAAYGKVEEYTRLVGQGPQSYVESDIDLTPFFQVLVLDVRLVKAKWLGAATWGIFPPSRASLECEWDLVAVEAAVET